MPTHHILCMKWGKMYGPDYVNMLFRAAKDYCTLDHDFICLTDDTTGLDDGINALPIPDMGLTPEYVANGGWPKLSVFKPSLYGLTGRALFIDLDVILVDKIDPLFQREESLLIIREWPKWGHRLIGKTEQGGNSAVFAFDLGGQTQIYDTFLAEPEKVYESFRIEQRFLSHHAHNLHYWPENWCLSFKRHMIRAFPFPPRRLPEGARIITFHGRPKPHELARGGLWGKGVRSGWGVVPFARDYWQKYEMGR